MATEVAATCDTCKEMVSVLAERATVQQVDRGRWNVTWVHPVCGTCITRETTQTFVQHLVAGGAAVRMPRSQEDRELALFVAELEDTKPDEWAAELRTYPDIGEGESR